MERWNDETLRSLCRLASTATRVTFRSRTTLTISARILIGRQALLAARAVRAGIAASTVIAESTIAVSLIPLLVVASCRIALGLIQVVRAILALTWTTLARPSPIRLVELRLIRIAGSIVVEVRLIRPASPIALTKVRVIELRLVVFLIECGSRDVVSRRVVEVVGTVIIAGFPADVPVDIRLIYVPVVVVVAIDERI